MHCDRAKHAELTKDLTFNLKKDRQQLAAIVKDKLKITTSYSVLSQLDANAHLSRHAITLRPHKRDKVSATHGKCTKLNSDYAVNHARK